MVYGSGDTTTTPTTIHSHKTVEDFNDYSLTKRNHNAKLNVCNFNISLSMHLFRKFYTSAAPLLREFVLSLVKQ